MIILNITNEYFLKKMKFLIGLSIILFSSCGKCDEMCPGLDKKYKAWIHDDDEIKYRNTAGNTISFTLKKSVFDEPTLKCGSYWGGCICHDCQSPQAYFESFTADSSRKQLDSLGNFLWVDKRLSWEIQSYTYLVDTATNKYSDTARLTYYIMGNKNYITIDPILKLSSGDSLLSSFATPNQTYSNVIKHTVDTSVSLYPNSYTHYKYSYFVLVSYITKEKGIVAFYDKLTQSLFYRIN